MTSAKTFTIVTFNVNSIRQRLAVVLELLEKRKPDVLALQETKVEDKDFPEAAFKDAGWNVIFHGQKTFNGVALISKTPAKGVIKGVGGEPADKQARLIAAEFDGITIVNTYIPQGQSVESDKYAYKLAWFRRLGAFLDEHYKPTQPLIWLGDINVAPEDADVYAPEFLDGEVSLTAAEREALERVRAWGFTDVFRKLHPDAEKAFTFFDYRVRDSVKYKKGWRIDHIYATAPLAGKIASCEIDMEIRKREAASDHAPLVASFKLA